jgi:hypothetical protein
MKIAGRIIRDNNIFENDSETFFAKYKGYEIHTSLFKKHEKANNEYSYTIIKIKTSKKGGDNQIVCSGILQRCDIRDVVIHAINEAEL